MKSIVTWLVVMLAAPSALAITKCQDADGKWHYGDFAIEACKNSKITEMNERAVVVNEIDAPKTPEELEKEMAQKAREKALADAENAREEEKRRVLSIYETEADIDRLRGNQINSVQSNIDVHKAYLKSMESRIARYQKKLAAAQHPAAKKELDEKITEAEKSVKLFTHELSELEEQKNAINKKFDKEKELYLRLRGR